MITREQVEEILFSDLSNGEKFDLFMLHVLKNDTQFSEGRLVPGAIDVNDKR